MKLWIYLALAIIVIWLQTRDENSKIGKLVKSANVLLDKAITAVAIAAAIFVINWTISGLILIAVGLVFVGITYYAGLNSAWNFLKSNNDIILIIIYIGLSIIALIKTRQTMQSIPSKSELNS